MNFGKFLITPFSQNTSGRLLLVMHVVFNLLYDIDYQCSLQKLIDSHWFKNVLVEWFCNQLCLFFFHKIMKFYQDICFAWTSRTSAAFFFSQIEFIINLTEFCFFFPKITNWNLPELSCKEYIINYRSTIDKYRATIDKL